MALTVIRRQRSRRQDDVRQALASVRLEGLEPGPEAKAIFQRYANGELTLKQMAAGIEALHDREYGPVHVSRNKRP